MNRPGSFDSSRWHLAGTLQRGVGRSWLVTNHGLDDLWGQGPWCMAASTADAGMRWLRDQFDYEADQRIPVRVHAVNDRLTFVYVSRKYIPADKTDRDDGDRGEGI